MRLHIVMPSYRWWNLLSVKANIEWAVSDLSRMTWTILMFDPLYENYPDYVRDRLCEPVD